MVETIRCTNTSGSKNNKTDASHTQIILVGHVPGSRADWFVGKL